MEAQVVLVAVEQKAQELQDQQPHQGKDLLVELGAALLDLQKTPVVEVVELVRQVVMRQEMLLEVLVV